MQRIARWKFVALTVLVPLLALLTPVISYACDTSTSHCGG